MDNLIGSTKAVFTVSLSVAVSEIVQVDWSTRDGTAKSGIDYEATMGVVSFAPGETTKQFEVVVYGQQFLKQDDKNFFVSLSPPSNAVLSSSLLECIISVDDGVSVLSIVVPQGKRGFKGDPGLSAYEQAVLMGQFEGTIEQWMNDIANASKAADRANTSEQNASNSARRSESAATSASFMGNIFPSPEAGVDPVTGVLNSAYYNVRSPSDDSYLIEYQNVGGVPTPSGKSYPSSSYVRDVVDRLDQNIELGNKKLSTTYDIADASNDDRRLLSDVFTTLAAAKLVYPFATDLTGSLGWAVLQKQMNELDANTAAKKVIAGNYFVNNTLKYEAKSNVEFNARLTLSGGVIGQYAIEFNNTDLSKLSGKLILVCDISDPYENHNWSIRSWWEGCLFKRVTSADSSSLVIDGKLKGQMVTVDGVVNNGNYASFGTISGICGSRAGDWTVTIIAVSNLGTADSATQTAELTLSVALPPQVVGHIAKIGADYHYIRAVSGNKITVEVWVDPANTSLSVIYGGIARSTGDNANAISFRLLRGFRSATTYSCSTTMGVLVSTFGSEYNEIGVILGAGYTTNVSLNYLDVTSWYSELNAIDVFDTRTSAPLFEFLRIKNDVGLGLVNWASNVFKASPKNSAFVRNKLYTKANVLLGESFTNLTTGDNGLSSSNAFIYVGEKRELLLKNDAQTIQLDCTSKKIKNYGRNIVEITQFGSNLNGGVTGTTLQCFSPFKFRNPSESNGMVYYLGRTSKPRELKIVVNDNNIIDVYEINTDAPRLLTDLSERTGSGVFRYNIASTANLGTNPPATNGVVRVSFYSTDVYTYEAVEELYSYDSSGVLIVRKLRVKRGDNISAWIDLPIGQLTSIASLSAAAPVADVVTAFNALIADLKAKKLMN